MKESFFEMIARVLRDGFKAVRETLYPTKSDLVRHAEGELSHAGMWRGNFAMRWMGEDLLELIKVFSSQHHNAWSSSVCVKFFDKLARHEPITPLSGEPSEFKYVGFCGYEHLFQNIRCPRVIAFSLTKDAPASVTEGVWPVDTLFSDTKGLKFTAAMGEVFENDDSHVPITFPYTPVSVTVRVDENGKPLFNSAVSASAEYPDEVLLIEMLDAYLGGGHVTEALGYSAELYVEAMRRAVNVLFKVPETHARHIDDLRQ